MNNIVHYLKKHAYSTCCYLSFIGLATWCFTLGNSILEHIYFIVIGLIILFFGVTYAYKIKNKEDKASNNNK